MQTYLNSLKKDEISFQFDAKKLPLLVHDRQYDSWARYELVYYDPFEVANEPDYVQVPKKYQN